jgi:hypothetical protein
MPGTGRAVLGGWLDLREDVGRLTTRVSASDDRCHCGGHDAACACCSRDGGRGPVCATCADEIRGIAEHVRRVEDDALRYLPATIALYAHSNARRHAAAEVERAVAGLLSTFQALRAATDEWAAGCRTTHVPAIGARTTALREACDRLHLLFTDSER